MPGHTLARLDPTEAAAWKRAAQPIVDKWVKTTPNGDKVLAAYIAEYDKALKEGK
jgi:hypothetical protein